MKVALSVLALVVTTALGVYGLFHAKPNMPKSTDVNINDDLIKTIIDKPKVVEKVELELSETNVIDKLTEDQRVADLIARVEVSDDPEKYFALGEMYENGTYGINKNQREAYAWYEKSAVKNHKIGLYKIGELLMNSPEFEDNVEAFKYMQKSASQGYAPAQLEVGNFYAEAIYVKQDIQKSIEMYEKASAQGSGDADLNLGVLYQTGNGVEKDPEVAFKYFYAAAKKGQVDAQYNIGVAYYFGYGVEVDVYKAREWLLKAYLAGKVEANELLKMIVIA